MVCSVSEDFVCASASALVPEAVFSVVSAGTVVSSGVFSSEVSVEAVVSSGVFSSEVSVEAVVSSGVFSSEVSVEIVVLSVVCSASISAAVVSETAGAFCVQPVISESANRTAAQECVYFIRTSPFGFLYITPRESAKGYIFSQKILFTHNIICTICGISSSSYV